MSSLVEPCGTVRCLIHPNGWQVVERGLKAGCDCVFLFAEGDKGQTQYSTNQPVNMCTVRRGFGWFKFIFIVFIISLKALCRQISTWNEQWRPLCIQNWRRVLWTSWLVDWLNVHIFVVVKHAVALDNTLIGKVQSSVYILMLSGWVDLLVHTIKATQNSTNVGEFTFIF